MLPVLAAFAAAFAAGFGSAVFPLINAEAATLVAAGLASPSSALAGVFGIALGQTAGKIAIYEASRAGRALAMGRRARRALEGAGQEGADLEGTDLTEGGPSSSSSDGESPLPPGRRARLKAASARFNAKLLDSMDGRGAALGVILLSAGVGIPPLLLTAVAAGALRMRRLDFIAGVAAGRTVRFLVIAWPVLALR